MLINTEEKGTAEREWMEGRSFNTYLSKNLNKGLIRLQVH